MINLIPPLAKKKIVIEYWVRTISIWLWLAGTALFLIAILFIPLNIYIINQESYLSATYNSNKTEQTNHQKNLAQLTKANQQAQILLTTKSEYTMSELLLVLFGAIGNEVKLDEISLNQMIDPVLVVSGVATDRQSLVQLRDTLEAEENFLTVDLPISNLIKEQDIPFSITAKLATSSKKI